MFGSGGGVAPVQGLTIPQPDATNYPPARHRTPADIMSEYRATSSRNARATSSESAPRGFFAAGSFHDLPGLLWAGTDRPQEAPDLPNLGSHGLAQVHALASPAPMPEIAVALAPRSARAFCPTVHAAACPTCYRCLSTGVTRSSSRSTPAGFGQIGEPSVNVSLTHGLVCHS